MEIVTLENGAVKCVVDSMKDIIDLFNSGKSREITQLDLSKIGKVFNRFNLSGGENYFSKRRFPKLDYINYDNPSGIISEYAFERSGVKKADINCVKLGKYAFNNSLWLEEIDIKDTCIVNISGLNSTKVSKIGISPETKSLYIPKDAVRVVFKEYDAQGLPISNLEDVDMGDPSVYLEKYGFDNFKYFLLYNPQLFLDCKHDFTQSEAKEVKRMTDECFRRKLQELESIAENYPMEADKMAKSQIELYKKVKEKIKEYSANGTHVQQFKNMLTEEDNLKS